MLVLFNARPAASPWRAIQSYYKVNKYDYYRVYNCYSCSVWLPFCCGMDGTGFLVDYTIACSLEVHH